MSKTIIINGFPGTDIYGKYKEIVNEHGEPNSSVFGWTNEDLGIDEDYWKLPASIRRIAFCSTNIPVTVKMNYV